MDYYKFATDKEKVAILTKDAGFYADSIYASWLAIEFADKFLYFVKLAKGYVDDECISNIDDLKKKFK